MRKMNTQWLQDQIEVRGLLKQQVALRLNLHPSSISQLLAGKRKLSINEANEFAKLLNVPLDELLSHLGMNPPPIEGKTMVALRGWIDGDYRVHWGSPKGTAKSAPRPANAQKDVRVVRFQTLGSKLEPMDGALAYYHPRKTVDPGLIGKTCLLQILPDDKWVFGVLKRGYQAGRYSVISLSNEPITENVQLGATVPIVWLKL